MIVKQTIFCVLAFLLLVGTVVAADLSPSTITTNPDWLVVNKNSVPITVHVIDGTTSTDVNNAQIDFSVSDPAIGTLSPVQVLTGPDGIATTTFTAGSVSGNATITAVITYNNGTIYTQTLTTFQLVDHDVAQYRFYDYATQIPVGSVTPLTITLTDRYRNPTLGNRIDNKNPAQVHTVQLSGLGSGGSGFWDGSDYVSNISLSTNAEGNATVNVRVSETAGFNTIFMRGIDYVPDDWSIAIEGVSIDDPVTISQIHPSPNSYPADGTHAFPLYYSVRDPYGNALDGTYLWINSSGGESYRAMTASGGIAYVSYGPKDKSGIYTITARSEKNSTVVCSDTETVGYCSQTVEYYSQDPVNMILTASPQTLVSLDVDPDALSTLRARVVDVAGNGVKDQTVTFFEGAESFPGAPNGTYTETAGSYLSSGTAVTDADGFATISFIPGRFASSGDDGYNATATGVKTVTARWTNPKTSEVIENIATFTWKNYPYLTVTTLLDKDSAKIGEMLRLTIIVEGNGAALQPKPIDVVMVMDRSGSMEGARMTSAKSAANTFIENMKAGNNQVGLVSFATDTTKDQTLTNDFDGVKVKVNKLNADGATQMRRALYEGITEVQSHGRSGAVKAVILLTDGDWNYDGSPLGHGVGWPEGNLNYTFSGNTNEPDNYRYYSGLGGTVSEQSVVIRYRWGSIYKTSYVCTDGEFVKQNMSVYANQSQIRIYALSFQAEPSSYVQKSLHIMTNSTAGYYRHAPDEAELNSLYSQIAGDLIQQAGGQTALSLDMGNIVVDKTTVSSYDYLNYTAVPVGGRGLGLGEPADSTYITMYHTNKDDSVTQLYNYTRDDTPNWTAASRRLDFEIGTMKLDDIWKTSMLFNLTKNGTIVLFAPGSGAELTFTDSSTGNTQTVSLDSKTVSVYKSTVDEGFGAKSLLVDQLKIIGNPSPQIWTLQWNTLYTGDSVARQKVQYLSSEPDSMWVTLPHQINSINPTASGIPTTSSIQIDTSSWTPGATYTLMVTAEAVNNDAYPSSATIGKMVEPTTSEKTYIRLQ